MKIVKNEALSTPYTPTQTINQRQEWISYGADNMYPHMLLDLLDKSSIHNAIQLGKHELTIGQGITFDETNLTPDAKIRLNKLQFTPNSKETLEDIYYKIAYDLIIFGGYALQVIWSKDRESISEIYHMDFSKIRVGKPNDDGIVDTYYYSDDWSQWKKEKYAPQAIKPFNIDDRKDPLQLIYFKQYAPSQPFYPAPTYVASIPSVLTDYEIQKFHLNSIQNGLSPNYMLNIASGLPSEEEQDEFYLNFKREMTGAGGLKVMITWSEGQDQAPQIIPIQVQDEHQKFITLSESVTQSILTANRLTSPMLMGIKTQGQLGGRTELVEAFEIYYEQVIKKLQGQLNKTLDSILRINNVPTYTEVIKPSMVAPAMSEAIASRVLTINELRRLQGFEDITNGENLLP